MVAVGGTLNVLSMMSANLVGFSIGLDGLKVMWSQILGSWSGEPYIFLGGFMGDMSRTDVCFVIGF